MDINDETLPSDEGLWRRLAQQMIEDGVVSDEDEAWLTSSGIKRNFGAIDAKFRALGFNGGTLIQHSFSRGEEGWASLIYDSGRYDTPREVEAAWEAYHLRRLKERLNDRIEDWLRRLDNLRTTLENWLPTGTEQHLHIVDRRPVHMHEELMQRYGIPAREMPSYEISSGNRPVLRVQPKGLWIIGGNGRVDFITNTESLVVVDMAAPLSEVSDWHVYNTRSKRQGNPLTRELFLECIGSGEKR